MSPASASVAYNSAVEVMALEVIWLTVLNTLENTAHDTNEADFEPPVKNSASSADFCYSS